MGGLYFLCLLGYVSGFLYISTIDSSIMEIWWTMPFAIFLFFFWLKTYPPLMKYSQNRQSSAFPGILDYIETETGKEAEISISQSFGYLAITALLIGLLLFIFTLLTIIDMLTRPNNIDWIITLGMMVIGLLLFNFFLYPLLVLMFFKVNNN